MALQVNNRPMWSVFYLEVSLRLEPRVQVCFSKDASPRFGVARCKQKSAAGIFFATERKKGEARCPRWPSNSLQLKTEVMCLCFC